MRYQIVRSVRATGAVTNHQEANSLEMAKAIYADQKNAVQPGEEVTLEDQKKVPSIQLRWYRETAEDNLADAVRDLTHRIEYDEESNRKTLETFIAKLTEVVTEPGKDPTYEFRWGDSKFEAAGRLYVARWAQATWDEGKALGKSPIEVMTYMQSYLLKEALRGAGDAGRWSGSSHNVQEAQTLAAKVRFLETVQDCLRLATKA